MHPQIAKLCTGYFEKHLRRDCQNEKITRSAYIKKFILENPDVPRDLYGSSFDRIMKEKTKEMKRAKPLMKDFNLPESQTEWELMILKLGECGFDQTKAVSIIAERKVQFDAATQAWSNLNKSQNE